MPDPSMQAGQGLAHWAHPVMSALWEAGGRGQTLPHSVWGTEGPVRAGQTGSSQLARVSLQRECENLHGFQPNSMPCFYMPEGFSRCYRRKFQTYSTSAHLSALRMTFGFQVLGEKMYLAPVRYQLTHSL